MDLQMDLQMEISGNLHLQAIAGNLHLPEISICLRLPAMVTGWGLSKERCIAHGAAAACSCSAFLGVTT